MFLSGVVDRWNRGVGGGGGGVGGEEGNGGEARVGLIFRFILCGFVFSLCQCVTFKGKNVDVRFV